MSLASSAFEDQILPALGGRRLSNGEIADAIATLLGETQPAIAPGQEFSATFAARPCEVRFIDGEAAVRLFFTAFDSPEAQYPALTVDAQYAVSVQEGAVVLTRKGSVRVTMAAATGGQRAAGGRQQTLRVAVQRKLNKVLPESVSWKPSVLSGPNGKPLELQIERATANDGWLCISLGRG